MTGIDLNITEVDLINDGQSPIIEKDVGEILADGVDAGRIRAVAESATANIDVNFVCVGTPSNPNGSLDLRYVRTVCTQTGQEIANMTPGFKLRSFHRWWINRCGIA